MNGVMLVTVVITRSPRESQVLDSSANKRRRECEHRTPGYNCGMRLGMKDARRTEQRLSASKKLDRMTAQEIVRLMNREDRKVAEAVGRELPRIARAVDGIVEAMRAGGRLIYVGAGSSGRMAVLDAAGCPP